MPGNNLKVALHDLERVISRRGKRFELDETCWEALEKVASDGAGALEAIALSGLTAEELLAIAPESHSRGNLGFELDLLRRLIIAHYTATREQILRVLCQLLAARELLGERTLARALAAGVWEHFGTVDETDYEERLAKSQRSRQHNAVVQLVLASKIGLLAPTAPSSLAQWLLSLYFANDGQSQVFTGFPVAAFAEGPGASVQGRFYCSFGHGFEADEARDYCERCPYDGLSIIGMFGGGGPGKVPIHWLHQGARLGAPR